MKKQKKERKEEISKEIYIESDKLHRIRKLHFRR